MLPADQNATKIQVAREVVQGILDKLGPNDSVGIVLFSDGACAPLQLGPVRCIDIPALKAQASQPAGSAGATETCGGCEGLVSQTPGPFGN